MYVAQKGAQIYKKPFLHKKNGFFSFTSLRMSHRQYFNLKFTVIIKSIDVAILSIFLMIVVVLI
jgi:hypothetical protein